MSIKLGINGFGRIGRVTFRSLLESGRDDLEVVSINSRGSAESAAHLFKYDSIFGVYDGVVESDIDSLLVDGVRYGYQQHSDIRDIDWGGVDIVLECSGKFKDRNILLEHFNRGASYVVLAYPCSGVDKTIVYGVNHLDMVEEDRLISNASCTTNCLAPLVRLLEDEFGIVEGYMTTIHSYTGDQNLIDSSHSDLRRARSAATSIIPTSTGAATNIDLIIPELSGKLRGSALRVPTANVSCIDLVLTLGSPVSLGGVNDLIFRASEDSLSGILSYSDSALVSVDFVGNSSSCIFDATQTEIIGERLVRILAWYDNEWGFSCRLLDVSDYIGRNFL